jgi:hypothetical protein
MMLLKMCRELFPRMAWTPHTELCVGVPAADGRAGIMVRANDDWFSVTVNCFRGYATYRGEVARMPEELEHAIRSAVKAAQDAATPMGWEVEK